MPRFSDPEPCGEMESGTFSGHALHPDPAAHHFHQSPGNAQPQAGTAITTRDGTVRLGKGLENIRLFLQRNADSRIPHAEVEPGLPLLFPLALYLKDHLSVCRELDRIPQQV